MGAARDQGLDPEWPPVLVALVLLAVGIAVVSVLVVYRALRAETRADRQRRRSGRSRG
jgi:uncharacterized protein (DUF2062 family)